jgi:hypothetical protein
VKRLALTEIARADLASIRRYSTRTWGRNQTTTYMDVLRDTMKALVRSAWSRVRAQRTRRVRLIIHAVSNLPRLVVSALTRRLRIMPAFLRVDGRQCRDPVRAAPAIARGSRRSRLRAV